TVNLFCATLHERKQMMEENADVFVALEGGLGTIDEIISALVSMTFFRAFQPIMMLNRDGIYSPLKQLFDTLTEHRLAGPPATDAVSFLPDIESLLTTLEAEARRLEAAQDNI
ncbi:MAG: LOG family protein, partial [Muribaculaceae bacterium]|nr:LOG family protein [Muribaculaceae bacterium]